MDTTLARAPIGQLLDGRYRVESHVANGGMATVYAGTDTRLDRTVALKIMRAELANDEDFVRRFVSEARSVAKLSHPNVVTVFDQGADGRTLFLAMEYVPGRTLRDLLRERGRLGPREALDICGAVLAGLAAAHTAGIAHRDVKPENVLIGDGHTVKVADFGLARLVSGASQTKSGMIIGTAAYLAPEQVLGRPADARTDVYAAGVMLFELLTGHQPHTGDTPLQVAYKHVNETVPPPSSLVPGLPAALDALVALATSRDPQFRPGDAGHFLHAIAEARNGLPLSLAAGPPAPPVGAGPSPSSALTVPPAAGYQVPPPSGPVPSDRPAALPGPPAAFPAVATPGHAAGPGRDSLPPPGRVIPPGSWRAAPAGPQETRRDMIPGLFGAERRPPAGNKTLVVASGEDQGYPAFPYPVQPGPREPRLARLLFSRRLGYTALAATVVLVVSLLGWWVLSGRYTTVPKVTGLTALVAQNDLRDAGLTVTLGSSVLDNQVAKGLVIKTSPATGARISRGGKVTLIVSAGPHMLSMPQATGMSLQDAENTIRHAGLVPGKVTPETSATIPVGIVISTRPVPGTSWPQPRPVSLVVSAGPPLPNFVGGTRQDAEAWAAANHVQLNERAARTSDKPLDTVLRQSLPPGSPYSQNQVITIVYSSGPPVVAVPNVDGMRVAQAERVLARAGFQVSIDQKGPLDVVFDYNPKGSAPKGSMITIVVGLPAPSG